MDSEYQLDIDVHRMCRLCLTVDEANLKNFFCSDILDGAIVAFPKIYKNVTEIETKKDDKLPQGICVNCKQKVSEFHLFKQRCINSNTLLCKILDVPVSVKLTEKPSQSDKSTQSSTCDTLAQGTQTDKEDEPTQLMKLHDGRQSGKAMTVKQTFKHEVEQNYEEFADDEAMEAEDYVLDYECSEYLSPDNLYIIDDEGSTTEANEESLVEQVEYKVEATEEEDKMEELEFLDVPDTYNVIKPSKSTTSKRSKRTSETCSICKVNLKSNIVNSHRNFHQQTLPMILDSIPYFRCGRCKTVFAEIGHMESHFENGSCTSYVEEPTCTDYQYLEDFPECEEGGPFSACRTLRLSSVMQTSDDTLTCELCYNFTSSSCHDILVHCVQHFSNDKENNVVYYDELMPGPHRCGVCQLNHPSLSAALRHVFFHLSAFICPVKDCDDKFSEFQYLSLHIELCHMGKGKVKHQRCMHCGKESETYQAFRQHQRKECEKKVFRCDVCEKKFFHKSSLSMHMKYHLAARYACDVCNKTFSQLCDYKVHYRIHSGEKPYKCEHCEKSFRSISNRKDHMSTHRTEKMFTCEICSQTFKSERTLRGHYPIHNATKKFQCNQCDKSFHRRFHLTLHLKSHDKKEYRLISTTTIPAVQVKL